METCFKTLGRRIRRRSRQRFCWLASNLLALIAASTALAGTFGTVVPVGGHASDLALDERRGVVYVANFTANRVDVISTETRQLQTSFNVSPQPGALALSPNGRYLVVAHFGNATSSQGANGLTVFDLDANLRQAFALGSPPLGIAFGADDQALVVTTTQLMLLEPMSGATQVLSTFSDLTAKSLPVTPGTFPPQIVRASVAASRDALVIYGIAEAGGENKCMIFRYDVNTKSLQVERWVASPPLGPRVMSVADDGSAIATGWGVFAQGILMAEFRNASGVFNTGTVLLDSARGAIYAQVAQSQAQKSDAPAQAAVVTDPVLIIADADNLTERERLRLPENLAGRSVLNSAGTVIYAVSDSGVLILPVGSLAKAPRVSASAEDLVFRGQFCDRRTLVQEFDLVDPGGNRTDFAISTTTPGVMVSPTSGTTPARIKVAISPSAFATRGTTTGTLDISSVSGVNVAYPVRLLVNNREPDQRGTFVNIAGRLVDILADPARNRFYVLRQDKNQVIVLDGSTYRQLAVLRTGNTPTAMAMTIERKYLMVGNDDSQIANVYDLEKLQPTAPIVFPAGHYPRSIAVSGTAMLASTRVAGPTHVIDRIDMNTRTASPLATLGIWENKIDVNTVLASSPTNGSILVAQSDGTVMLYDATQDTFVAARKDLQKAAGAYAAMSDKRFVVDTAVLNESLYPVGKLENGTGLSSGLAVMDQYLLRTTAPSAAQPGVIAKVDVAQATNIRPTRTVEAPVLSEAVATVTGSPFTRTLAPLASRTAVVSLSTSGVTVLPWQYDAAVAQPTIDAVKSAADGSSSLASGGLVTITGRDLSLTNMASNEVPLPTALADSCLTINGVLAPMVMVSATQVNAQLPALVSGPASVVLRTPAGVSNTYRINVAPAAPTVFRGDLGATVVRAVNGEVVTLSNPVHPNDWLVIYATGLGMTAPAVDDGYPGPADPLAEAVIHPEVTLGGVPLEISYAGLAPGQVGVYQINAKVSSRVPEGVDVPLNIAQAGTATTLSVRVVK